MEENICDLHIDSILNYLAQYEWVHSISVTELLKKKILFNLPTEWLDHLLNLSFEELNSLPYLGLESITKYPSWPSTLHEFIQKAAVMSFNRKPSSKIHEMTISTAEAEGMNEKKLHEVSRMAPFIDDLVSKTSCDLIVDVGSGLGYLDHILHQEFGHKVIGLEVNESHITSAEKRAFKQDIRCNCLKSIKFTISNDSNCVEKFEEQIRQLVPTIKEDCEHTNLEKKNFHPHGSSDLPRVCLIGLHCCGDLTPALLSLFHSASCVQSLCCISCCYHKMAYSSGFYPSFPLSSVVKKKFTGIKKIHPSWHITPCTLRLGAQQTRASWLNQSAEDHMNHLRHVAFRALLEMTDLTEIRRRVRKCDFSSFSGFLDSFFPEQEKTEQDEMYRSRLSDLYKIHTQEINNIEIFTVRSLMCTVLLKRFLNPDT
ncbi:hypothetical protein Btru_005493 [Bulinus truncatus]|nr:hypothetical protein Btru_005493 [Bulinus truncatus]